jgi:hypothetical protein
MPQRASCAEPSTRSLAGLAAAAALAGFGAVAVLPVVLTLTAGTLAFRATTVALTFGAAVLFAARALRSRAVSTLLSSPLAHSVRVLTRTSPRSACRRGGVPPTR